MLKLAIIDYNPKMARALVDIFYYTVHNINSADYSPAQIKAWAPQSFLNLEYWLAKWTVNAPIVAVSGDTIVGFAELEDTGFIDCFYVHHEYQGVGAGGVLLQEILRRAANLGIAKLYADVSISAKGFFQKHGFKVVRAQQLQKRGQSFDNFYMERNLT